MKKIELGLTFDDVLIEPAHSKVHPCCVNLQTKLTRNISLNIPLVAAAMETVCEAKMAIALADKGGIGIIHKNMTSEQQAREVQKVKRFENGVIRDPISAPPNYSLKELIDLGKRYNISSIPIIDSDDQLLGIVTKRDISFEDDLSKSVSSVMTPKEKLITVNEGVSKEEVIDLLHKHRLEKIMIVNDSFQLRGMFTARGILKAKQKPFGAKDKNGRLLVGAAISGGEKDRIRIERLLEKEVDVLVVDSAHGHSQTVIDSIKWIKKSFPAVEIIGGNIATFKAAKALKKAGVDGVKVGIGPGSICTTRIISGIGVPQISAILAVAEALKNSNIPIIADGGIRFSGDITKALAAGASSVMIGGLLAGTNKSPGNVEYYRGWPYKNYYGMGSVTGMNRGSSDRYFQEFSEQKKLVPEGVEGKVPYTGSLAKIVYQLMGGLRSGMGYAGCSNISDLKTNTKLLRLTEVARKMSHVHNIAINRQPPNYWCETDDYN